MKSVVPTKCVKIFPNNKPWITSDIKAIINRKKEAFGKNDKEEFKKLQKELNRTIRKGKRDYKIKIENHFTQNNMKRVWQGMRLMSGYNSVSSKADPLPKVSPDYAGELNRFYNRFDCHDFSSEIRELFNTLSSADDLTFLQLEEDEVRKEFSGVNPTKAAGPDNVSPCVLKHCSSQLAHIFTHIFNLSFQLGCIPKIWKLSCIIPVPKKPVITCNNDLRPVALTSVIMKSAERLTLKLLKKLVAPYLDSLQFAYSDNRGTEDAILFTLEKLYSHLELSKFGRSARVLYFDFSSAFNTIQPHILARKLISMNVPPQFTTWILDYLTNRTQFVLLKQANCRSDVLISNTGAPQGTVLAPFLFTIYTSDIRSNYSSCQIVKYADDTALIGLIDKDDNVAYLKQIQEFVDYCDENFLLLNVSKTKELIIDFRTKRVEPDTVIIKGSGVERPDYYKYLGLVMDNRLSWHDHIDHICKKIRPRMYCLRKMKKFEVSPHILTMFYDSVIAGVWKYCISAWGGNANGEGKKHLASFVTQSCRVVGQELPSYDEVHKICVQNKMNKIQKDVNHPLYRTFQDAISHRSGRMIYPYSTTNRHKSSFVVQAMRIFNKNYVR